MVLTPERRDAGGTCCIRCGNAVVWAFVRGVRASVAPRPGPRRGSQRRSGTSPRAAFFLRWRQVRQAPRGALGEYRRRRGLPGDPSGRGAGSNADLAGPFQGFDSTCG